MSEASERLVRRLQDEGEKTLAFFKAIDPQAWQLQVYSEGANWTVYQVLVHFVSAEQQVSLLVRHIADGGPGVPEDFDLDAYNERQVGKREAQGVAELLSEFAELRRQTVEMVSGFTDADLAREGRHPFLGIAPISDIIKLMYRHNQIHQRDLRRALSQPPGGS